MNVLHARGKKKNLKKNFNDPNVSDVGTTNPFERSIVILLKSYAILHRSNRSQLKSTFIFR